MGPLHSPKEYLFNLYTTNSGDAKRIWRNHIKESWNNECAYCGSVENITIDHVIPQSKGGTDTTKNVVCCCRSCNQSKGHKPWEEWYYSQEFFCETRHQKIQDWVKPEKLKNLYSYSRRNNAS